MKQNLTYSFSGSDLIGAAVEGLHTLKAGKKHVLRQQKLSIPPPVKPMKPREIVAIRKSLGASQAIFASVLNVPKVTLISWENGLRSPSGAALRLLEVVKKHPEAIAA